MSGKHKAIVLLPGGLDSTLAVKMMIDPEDRHGRLCILPVSSGIAHLMY